MFTTQNKITPIGEYFTEKLKNTSVSNSCTFYAFLGNENDFLCLVRCFVHIYLLVYALFLYLWLSYSVALSLMYKLTWFANFDFCLHAKTLKTTCRTYVTMSFLGGFFFYVPYFKFHFWDQKKFVFPKRYTEIVTKLIVFDCSSFHTCYVLSQVSIAIRFQALFTIALL